MLRQNVYDGAESKRPRNRLSLPAEARIVTVVMYMGKIRNWKFEIFRSWSSFPVRYIICLLFPFSSLSLCYLLTSIPLKRETLGCYPRTNFRFLLCCTWITNSTSSPLWDFWFNMDWMSTMSIIGPTSARFAIVCSMLMRYTKCGSQNECSRSSYVMDFFTDHSRYQSART